MQICKSLMLIEFAGLFQTAEKGDKMANKEIITKSGGTETPP